MTTIRQFLFVASLIISMPVHAMIIRHDRADSLYIALGKNYPMVGQIARMGGAALIAPAWAITAAHVADAIHFSAPTVRFGNQAYGIAEIFVHPEWTPEGRNDIALLRLADSVKSISPAQIYPSRDEAGKGIVFVGRGDWGTGLTGAIKKDGIQRGATNIVDSTDAFWLYFDLDSGSVATNLEGINGPGDSGSPTLINRNDTTFVVGVSSWGSPGPNGPRSYGCTDAHTRVSSYAMWIQIVMAGQVKGRRPQDTPAVTLPNTPAGQMVAAFIAAFNSDDEAQVTQFHHTYRASGALAQGTDDQRLESYYHTRDDVGRIELYKYVSETSDAITVQMATEIGAVLDFRFELEAEPPHGVTTIRISAASARR